MKKDIMEILCCPMCHSDLALEVLTENKEKDEIITGMLHCGRCKVAYPIIDSIPDLLPQNLK